MSRHRILHRSIGCARPSERLGPSWRTESDCSPPAVEAFTFGNARTD